MKRFISPRHYLQFLRRQPKHIQSVYGLLFAGVVTVSIGAVILYYDYGFWRDRYNRNEITEETTVNKDQVEVLSPGEMFGNLIKEARDKAKSITSTSSSFFEGTIEYSRDQENNNRQ